MKIILQTSEDVLLRKRIRIHTESSVREVVSVGRLMKKYYDVTKPDTNGRDPSAFCAIDNGFYCVFGGSGMMLKNFIETGNLGKYSGSNVVPKFPGDANYRKSLLRFAPFDQCFNFVNTDVDTRKFWNLHLHALIITLRKTYVKYRPFH